MKIKLSLLVVCALFLNLSCKKQVFDVNTGPCLPITFLSKVSGTTSLGGDGSLRSVNMTFVYDTNNHNRLLKIKDGQKSIELDYHNWIISKLQYSDSTTSVPDRRVITLLGVTLNSSPVAEIESIYQGDKLVSESRAEYIYNNEFATEVQRTFANNTKVVEKYTYQGGNIATYDNGKGITYSYKYDRKPNPFAYKYLQFRMGDIDFTSANSVIEVEVKENGVAKVSRTIYTYNPKGYPLTMKTTDSQGAVTVDYKFEYGSYQPGCY
jgi:hypothetical protein